MVNIVVQYHFRVLSLHSISLRCSHITSWNKLWTWANGLVIYKYITRPGYRFWRPRLVSAARTLISVPFGHLFAFHGLISLKSWIRAIPEVTDRKSISAVCDWDLCIQNLDFLKDTYIVTCIFVFSFICMKVRDITAIGTVRSFIFDPLVCT